LNRARPGAANPHKWGLATIDKWRRGKVQTMVTSVLNTMLPDSGIQNFTLPMKMQLTGWYKWLRNHLQNEKK